MTSVRLSYQALLVNLESAASANREVGEAAKAHGMLKKLRMSATLGIILMLSDVLPKLCALSLTFQQQEVCTLTLSQF